MKIALLISGHCRTFVYEEQRIFFEKLIKYLNKFGKCETYLMLKLDPMMQCISQLEKMIKMLNPVYSIAFKQWNQHDTNCYYSQMKMIRHLVDKSFKSNYDYYIRIRPDCVIPCLEEIQFNMSIISSRKFDARGNDQFFIMSQKMLNEWFLKLPIIPIKISPEYYIFNKIKVIKSIKSGLVRDYKRIESWNTRHSYLNLKDYWLPQPFVSISYHDFINKLKNIIHYQEVI
jgi:hypothetical protein